jgi:hypothetical protein
VLSWLNGEDCCLPSAHDLACKLDSTNREAARAAIAVGTGVAS